MTLATEPYSSRRDTVAFITCLLLAIVARAAPESVTEPIATGMRETVLVPFISLQNRTALIRLRRVEFATLLAERDSALALADRSRPLADENQRLRAVLGLSARIVNSYVAGEVLHPVVDPRRAVTLIVTAGRNHGVVEWSPVVAPQGLVGHVQTVDARSSIVLAWTHPDFRASALALDSISGIVAPRIGDGATTMLELREVAHRAEIPEGAMVVTSGLGGIYPRGIPIGRVRALIDEREGWSKTYLVEPAVHPAVASHVLVLLPDTANLSDAFAPSRR